MIDYCKGQIARYKIPHYIKFVNEFPMTVTGKIQKFQMRKDSIEELGFQKAASMKTDGLVRTKKGYMQ